MWLQIVQEDIHTTKFDKQVGSDKNEWRLKI